MALVTKPSIRLTGFSVPLLSLLPIICIVTGEGFIPRRVKGHEKYCQDAWEKCAGPKMSKHSAEFCNHKIKRYMCWMQFFKEGIEIAHYHNHPKSVRHHSLLEEKHEDHYHLINNDTAHTHYNHHS